MCSRPSAEQRKKKHVPFLYLQKPSLIKAEFSVCVSMQCKLCCVYHVSSSGGLLCVWMHICRCQVTQAKFGFRKRIRRALAGDPTSGAGVARVGRTPVAGTRETDRGTPQNYTSTPAHLSLSDHPTPSDAKSGDFCESRWKKHNSWASVKCSSHNVGLVKLLSSDSKGRLNFFGISGGISGLGRRTSFDV